MRLSIVAGLTLLLITTVNVARARFEGEFEKIYLTVHHFRFVEESSLFVDSIIEAIRRDPRRKGVLGNSIIQKFSVGDNAENTPGFFTSPLNFALLTEFDLLDWQTFAVFKRDVDECIQHSGGHFIALIERIIGVFF